MRLKTKLPLTSDHPDIRMNQLIDRSLVWLMYLALLAMIIVCIRLYQFGLALVPGVQLIFCSALFAALFFRRKIPQSVIVGLVVAVFFVVPTLGLIRFGLVSPALVVIAVFPIIVANTSGVKHALMLASAMLLIIIAVGTLYSFGIVQPDYTTQDYLRKPLSWVAYAVVYILMVAWGATIAAKLTEYWKASLQDLKQSEQETLREREIVSTLQRHQSIVQLSGGVAHDFNNILAVILFNLDTVKDAYKNAEESDIVEEALEDAKLASEKGAELTKSLMSFAKIAKLEPKLINVNSVIQTTLGWIGRTVPENIKIEMDLVDDINPITADEGSLLSALLNLIINARDAMPNGGYIRIKTQNIEIYENENRHYLNDISPGHYIELSIQDSGSGITVSEQKDIFEPFYTTKGPTEGSDLGLAMVHGFMKQSGGAVHVTSELHVGSTFTLLFQASTDSFSTHSVQNNVAATPQNERIDSSSKTVLIVEDEILILKSLKNILIKAGYQVRTATNGDQAWDFIRADINIDLVLSDVVMPGNIQGTDLVRNIQEANLNTPVILMSGYTFKADLDSTLPKVSQFLQKPIKKEVLLEAIEQALFVEP